MEVSDTDQNDPNSGQEYFLGLKLVTTLKIYTLEKQGVCIYTYIQKFVYSL